ncbi:MAG TPA: tRNA lysidine(34) synthetase TilS [Ilumatobacteraceae bacterium]|nr:tRNA lysidine(34) synthetase TilS [Ilumatobacteraceae bacterium]
MPDLNLLLERCDFPAAGTDVVCGLSGGPDSTALVALATAAGCRVTAVHVHHGLRDEADHDAEVARASAERLDARFRVVHVDLDDGPNLEARARAARRAALGPDAMTGHTADDQAETLLLALIRGAGTPGLAAIAPGPTHPILALRRRDTVAVCAHLELPVAHDSSNDELRFRRNRVRHELVPLLDEIAERDVTVLLARTAGLLRDDECLLMDLAAGIDPTDVHELLAAPRPLAARALRRWLELDGYPPDSASVTRVLAVANGDVSACQVAGGRRVERRNGRLEVSAPGGDTE